MALDYDQYPREGDALIDGKTVGHILQNPPDQPERPVVVGTPEWWLSRLLAKLIHRSHGCSAYADFAEGRQPLAFASQKFIEAYGARVRIATANFMPLIINAEKDRLVIDGFRFGSAESADKAVWKIWQENQLDAESQIAHEIALTKGVSYVAVDPTSAGASITIEDPSEVIVQTTPGNRRNRQAALKVFIDDDGYSRAYLYLPTEIYRWRSVQRRTDSTVSSLEQARWEPFTDDGGDAIIANRLGVVPIVPLINRPLLNGSGRSEIEPVIGNQLAINFLRYSALIGSDTAALPQRWAKNLDLQVDTDTGKVQEPFKTGQTLWASRRPTPEEVSMYGDRVPDVEFGQFAGASLSPFVDLINMEIRQMSAVSETPYYYLLGQGNSNPPSSEQTKSSEAPLVRKVQTQSIHFGEGWEEAMRVALLAVGQRAKASRTTDAETMWRDPETRNQAAVTDSVLKQFQAGLIPDRFALEEIGYSAQQIERIMAMKAAEPPAPPAPEVPGGEAGGG